MTIKLTSQRVLRHAAFAALFSIAAAGSAFASSMPYRFELAGRPASNTIAVRVVDTASGQPVTNVQLFALRRVFNFAKGMPRFRYERIALTSDGKGGFLYRGSDVKAGADILLIAQGSEISGSVHIDS